MFRAAHRSSSGAPNCVYSVWFIYTRGDRPLSSLSGKFPTQTWQRSVTACVYKTEAADTVWSSWWWAVCLSKHVEPSINVGIINSITRLHLVGFFYWFILVCWDMKYKIGNFIMRLHKIVREKNTDEIEINLCGSYCSCCGCCLKISDGILPCPDWIPVLCSPCRSHCTTLSRLPQFCQGVQ